MKKIAFWTVTAGAALLAACGQQESTENAAANNVVELPPENMAPPLETQDLNEVSDVTAAEETPQPVTPAEAPEQPARKARTEAPRSSPPEPRLQERAEPTAPKPEASPSPASTCTPEHEAMGHCKR